MIELLSTTMLVCLLPAGAAIAQDCFVRGGACIEQECGRLGPGTEDARDNNGFVGVEKAGFFAGGLGRQRAG